MRREKKREEDKPEDPNALTSRFRGVCWNKKNKRWQSALNTNGKYIYLGSYVEEEEAARMFDKASIAIRGDKAKPNFPLGDYYDKEGNFIEDPDVTAMVFKGDAADGGKKRGAPLSPHEGAEEARTKRQRLPHNELVGRNSSKEQSQVFNGTFSGGIFGSSLDFAALVNFAALNRPQIRPLKKMSPLNLPLPKGCSLESTIPCVASGSTSQLDSAIQEAVFGVLYSGPVTRGKAADGDKDKTGALVWDGATTHDLGFYLTDKDARQACTSCMGLVLHYLSIYTPQYPPAPRPTAVLPPFPPWPRAQAPASGNGNQTGNIKPPSGDMAGLSSLLSAGSLSLDKAGSINAALQHLLFGTGSAADLARSSSISLDLVPSPSALADGDQSDAPPAARAVAPSYGDLFSFLQAVPAAQVKAVAAQEVAEKVKETTEAPETGTDRSRGGVMEIKALANVSVAELKNRIKGKAKANKD